MGTAARQARPSAARFVLLVLGGILVLQAGWILALPPFAGSDEFDHVYRAAGVAEGQWRLRDPAANARGVEVAVPEEVVEAAFGQCDSLEYTGPGNCSAIADLPDGLVTVATAAGEYNPWFYAVIGFPTKTFSGAGTDYAMRVVSALICAGGICAAAGALSQRAAGAWTRLGFVMALSPVLVYSTVVPAPNAIEMVAGLCVWTGLLGMTQAHAKRERNWCLALATLAAVVLAVTRTLGPLWLALIVVTVVAFEGVRRTRETMRAAPGQIALAAALVGLSVAGAGLWLATAGPARRPLTQGGRQPETPPAGPTG